MLAVEATLGRYFTRCIVIADSSTAREKALRPRVCRIAFQRAEFFISLLAYNFLYITTRACKKFFENELKNVASSNHCGKHSAHLHPLRLPWADRQTPAPVASVMHGTATTQPHFLFPKYINIKSPAQTGFGVLKGSAWLSVYIWWSRSSIDFIKSYTIFLK